MSPSWVSSFQPFKRQFWISKAIVEIDGATLHGGEHRWHVDACQMGVARYAGSSGFA
jgi:hypothetical protein